MAEPNAGTDAEQQWLLDQGVEAWNRWRHENPEVRPRLAGIDLNEQDLQMAQLQGADLTGASLFDADLSKANLDGASLRGAHLFEADLRQARLVDADLHGANLGNAYLCEADLRRARLDDAYLDGARLAGANLQGASLREAYLGTADLSHADLSGADLTAAQLPRAHLQGAVLVATNLEGANLSGARVFGIATWGARLERATQRDLVITPKDEPTITIDDLGLAQMLCALLGNEQAGMTMGALVADVALILGRFKGGRKVALEAIRAALRAHGYVPGLLELDQPSNRDLTGTVRLLAQMARFILVDTSEPRYIPEEFQTVVPGLSVPVQPLVLQRRAELSMLQGLVKYACVLPPYAYKDLADLLEHVEDRVIAPAVAKAKDLRAAQ